jgi:hypothetical protein
VAGRTTSALSQNPPAGIWCRCGAGFALAAGWGTWPPRRWRSLRLVHRFGVGSGVSGWLWGREGAELVGVGQAAEAGGPQGAVRPRPPPGRTRSATRPPSPVRSARAITGTRPACDTRCRSSNDARVLAVRGAIALASVLSGRVREALATPILPAQRAHFMLTRPKEPLPGRWIEGLDEQSVVRAMGELYIPPSWRISSSG